MIGYVWGSDTQRRGTTRRHTFMHKHQTLVQSVTEPRRAARSAVRSMRAVSKDRALAQLIALHVPTAWRF